MEPIAETGSVDIPFEFRGNASEFFRIWIINLLLTLLTLGIYSAWAKIRTNRYFYGATRLDRVGFEYLADPVAILKGRFIAVALLAIYLLSDNLLPVLKWGLVVLFLAILPWLIIKAMGFRARNSAYRSLRFDFQADYMQALGIFVGLALLSGLTLGLAYPYFSYRKSRFLVEHSAYGASHFDFDARAKGFYGIYILAFALLIGLSVVVMLVMAAGGGFIAYGMGGGEAAGMDRQVMQQVLAQVLAQLLVLLYLILYLAIGAYIQTAVTNLIFNHVTIRGYAMKSTLRFGPMLWLYLSNTVGILLSLGLLIPWARIRMARYRLHNLFVVGEAGLDSFVAARGEEVAAIGEGVADVFDIDIGL